MKKEETNGSKNEILSLNDKLYNDFQIQELETRLETDPLMGGAGFVDITASSSPTECFWDDCFLDNCEFCNPVV